jgi:hypothetical protein
MFQVPWFCRQTEGLLYGSAAVAGLTALCQLGLGIYVLVAWNFPEKSNCEAFSLYSSSSWRNYDLCREEIWGTIAIVCAVLWAAAFGCLVHFIRSGRHAKWEKKHSGFDDNDDEEELEAPMGCWNNNKVDDTDVPVQSGKICFCLPYDDPFMITAQILAILAIFFSWVWWPTLIINSVGLVMFQVPWFCRQTEGVLQGSLAVAGLTALCQLGLGIYVLVDFRWWPTGTFRCEPFSLWSDKFVYRDDFTSPHDNCREDVWGTIAIVCAVLWAGAFGCLLHFIRSGRHANWEKYHSSCDDTDDAEVKLEAPMGCCNRYKVDDTDIPVQSCCSVRGKRCFCLPYDDPWMITAQILTMIAPFFSWVWWPTLIINIVGLVMFQVPWFCRQTEGLLYGSAAVAGLTALCQLGLGIYVLVAWNFPKKSYCETFFLYSSANSWINDSCQEEIWGTSAIVCAVLWAATFGCLVHFIRSGRHANWEKYHSSCDDTDDEEVELEAPMGCWNNNKVEDTDIPVQSCCSVRGKRCFCLPYDDPFMITAQILAILAIFFSWVWWPTLIINIVGLVMFQVPWFCRQTEGVLHGSAAVAGLTALCQLGVGIYLLVAFRFPKKSDCIKFELKSNSSRFPNDYCSEEIWGTIAIACAVLWAAAFGCLVHFVRSGRHAKWEKYHSGCDDNDDEAELEVAIGCCSKSKEDNRGYPEGAQLCCGGRGKRFFCLPYDDPFMIASQVLAIIAAFFSWIWWVTFIISIVGLVMFQVPWFCRQTEGLLYGSAAVAGLTALCQLGLGIYVLVAWNFPEKSNCEAFSLYSSSSWINDSCQEEIWGTIAIVCAVLWAATFGCLVHFIRTGRHAKWEEKHSGCDDNNGEVEAAGVAYLDAIDSVVAAEAAPVFAEAEVVAAGGSDENTKKEAGKPSKKKKSKKLVDRDIDVTDNLDDSDHPKKKKDRKKKKKVATVHEDIAFDFKEHAASDENDLVDRPKKKKKKKKVLQE